MIKCLSMAEVFNDKFDASMLKVNPECVKEPFDDGVTPHDHIEHAVKSHDDLVDRVERLKCVMKNLIETKDIVLGFDSDWLAAAMKEINR